MPAFIVASMQRYEESHGQATAVTSPMNEGKTRPGIDPESVLGRARLMQRVLPLVTSGAVQRLASWLSVLPPFRRAAYEIAGLAFMRRHVCRMAGMPLVLCQDFFARNQQVYETMWGPSEFFATGVLADWNVESRLGEIDVPTLLLSGRYDEATPAQQQRLQAGIRGSQWTLLEHSAHLTFIEEPERYLQVLTSFLDGVDAA